MLHLAGYLEPYAKKQPTRSISKAGVVMQLPEYSCQLSCDRQIIKKSVALREVWRVVDPSSGSSWQIMLR